MSAALASRVRRELMRQGSAALVPDVIAEVDALPFTHNGKASEAAARDAVNGLPVRNLSSLRKSGMSRADQRASGACRASVANCRSRANRPSRPKPICARSGSSFSASRRSVSTITSSNSAAIRCSPRKCSPRSSGPPDAPCRSRRCIIAPTVARLAAVIVEDGVQARIRISCRCARGAGGRSSWCTASRAR